MDVHDDRARPTARPFPGLNEAERIRHKGELVYPNLCCPARPTTSRRSCCGRSRSTAPRIVCDLLFAPDEVAAADFDPSDAGDLWDLVNQQDWAICESVQRGMSSRAYTHGWFAPMEDDCRRHPALAAAPARRSRRDRR